MSRPITEKEVFQFLKDAGCYTFPEVLEKLKCTEKAEAELARYDEAAKELPEYPDTAGMTDSYGWQTLIGHIKAVRTFTIAQVAQRAKAELERDAAVKELERCRPVYDELRRAVVSQRKQAALAAAKKET